MKAYVSALTLLLTAVTFNVLANTSYIEKNGIVMLEAEDFAAQHLDLKRRWFAFSKDTAQHHYADNDVKHFQGASQGAYIELLPDTRTNHSEELIQGENFTNQPGVSALLSYPIYFNTPGRYFVWVRAYSTGTEDNGVHIGLNSTWPESGQRLQLCENKHQWTWSSAQRVEDNHCGAPQTITINIPTAGVHNFMVSMREDGFEMDKILLTTDAEYLPKEIDIPATKYLSQALPSKQRLHNIFQYKKTLHATADFNIIDTGAIPFYQHEVEQALAINAAQESYRNKYAYAEYKVAETDAGVHQITLVTLSEIDGESHYKVLLNDKVIASFQNPETGTDYQESYFKIDDVTLKHNDVIKVAAMAVTNGKIPEDGGTAYARGRWRALVIGTN
ncbi:MAG: hypothetical protein ACSHW0_05060 [Thalassotalea sp.]